MVAEIHRNELQALIDRDEAVVLEVLPAPYFEAGHLPKAQLLPPDEIDALARVVAPDLDRTIVVYCSNARCNNSHVAARRLDQLGYTDVRRYVGGKADWSDAGLTLDVESRV